MRTPVSDRVCDAVCLAFALWTICCNGVVAAGGSLRDLQGVFLAASLIIGIVVLRRRQRRARVVLSPGAPDVPGAKSADAPADAPTGGPVAPVWPMARVGRTVGVLLGLVGLLIYVRNGQAAELWYFSVAVLLVALSTLLITRPQPEPYEPARQSRVLEGALWGIGAGCVVLTLVCHRPDWDDAYYVNMAVVMCDAPGEPLLVKDTLYGVAGLSLHVPAYRVHSYEAFNGALARITGVPAIYCFHWISASLAALLVPLAFARLFRILVPRYWLWGVVAILVVLVVTGETWRSYGNYAFVRMWAGKSIYLSVFLPLAYAYGLRFGAAPTSRHWMLMAAVQIAAVGCTSSALWSVPLATCLGMACSVRLGRGTLKTLALGVAASGYVLCVGLSIKGTMAATSSQVASVTTLGSGFSVALDESLGTGGLRLCGIAAVLFAWALLRNGPARRFAVLVPLISLLLILNPHLEEQVSRHLVGPSYWRAMWIMPIPILLALALTSSVQLSRQGAARGLALIAIAAFALFVPRITTLSRENSTIVGYPHLKVRWGGSYKWARELHESVPPGSQLVAPWPTALWLPTFHHNSHPLIVRYNHYYGNLSSKVGPDDLRYRFFMSDAVASGEALLSVAGSVDWDKQDELAQKFRKGLERFDIKGVCIRTTPRLRQIRPVLTSAGFVPRVERRQIEVWTRQSSLAGQNEQPVLVPREAGRAALGT